MEPITLDTILSLKKELRQALQDGKHRNRVKTLMLLRSFYESRTGKKAYVLLYYPDKLRNECIKLKNIPQNDNK